MPSEGRGQVVGYQIGHVVAGTLPDVNRYVYLLKLAAVQIRSIDPDAIVLQGRIPETAIEWQERVLAAALGPYVDGFALDATAATDTEGYRTSQMMRALLDRVKPAAPVVLGPIELPVDADPAAFQMLDRFWARSAR